MLNHDWRNVETRFMDYRLGLFVLTVLALDIWAIIKIVRGKGTVASKGTWITVIALLPILGLVVWAMLGPDVREPRMYEEEPP